MKENNCKLKPFHHLMTTWKGFGLWKFRKLGISFVARSFHHYIQWHCRRCSQCLQHQEKEHLSLKRERGRASGVDWARNSDAARLYNTLTLHSCWHADWRSQRESGRQAGWLGKVRHSLSKQANVKIVTSNFCCLLNDVNTNSYTFHCFQEQKCI